MVVMFINDYQDRFRCPSFGHVVMPEPIYTGEQIYRVRGGRLYHALYATLEGNIKLSCCMECCGTKKGSPEALEITK